MRNWFQPLRHSHRTGQTRAPTAGLQHLQYVRSNTGSHDRDRDALPESVSSAIDKVTVGMSALNEKKRKCIKNKNSAHMSLALRNEQPVRQETNSRRGTSSVCSVRDQPLHTTRLNCRQILCANTNNFQRTLSGQKGGCSTERKRNEKKKKPLPRGV